MTVADLNVGDDFPPNGRVYHLSEVSGGYRHLTIERKDGSTYTTHLHGSQSLAEAFGGGTVAERWRQ